MIFNKELFYFFCDKFDGDECVAGDYEKIETPTFAKVSARHIIMENSQKCMVCGEQGHPASHCPELNPPIKDTGMHGGQGHQHEHCRATQRRSDLYVPLHAEAQFLPCFHSERFHSERFRSEHTVLA